MFETLVLIAAITVPLFLCYQFSREQRQELKACQYQSQSTSPWIYVLFVLVCWGMVALAGYLSWFIFVRP